jgi:methyl-accepting chemotaxis protein
MFESSKSSTDRSADMQAVADALFAYLRDVIYSPDSASLNVDSLPTSFRQFGKGLVQFANMVKETRALATDLSAGNLRGQLPPPGNEVAAPLKKLHASLRHLTWQLQQVAMGDFQQRVDFMGEFSDAFNDMIEQLARQRNG